MRWLNVRELRGVLSETWDNWNKHNAPKLGAALSYYTVFSIAPLLVVIVAIVGFVLGKEAAQGQIMAQIQSTVGVEGAQAIQTVIRHADQPKAGVIATVLGLITLFLGASGVFAELRDSLNRIWEVKTRSASGVWGMARDRLLSFGMVLAIGFLLLVSLILSAAIAAAGKFVGGMLPIPEAVLHIVNIVFSFIVIAALFGMIYRVLPDDRIEWSDVAIGSAATALLFTLGKFAIGLYLGKASVGSAYGAAGSLVVLLAWIYYSAQIFFFGAEFTHVYAIRHGSHQRSEAEGAPVVTTPVAVSTPPDQRRGAPARPEPAAGRATAHENPHEEPRAMMLRDDSSAKAFRLTSIAALGGLGAWLARSGGRRQSGE
jgi:membrane protein